MTTRRNVRAAFVFGLIWCAAAVAVAVPYPKAETPAGKEAPQADASQAATAASATASAAAAEYPAYFTGTNPEKTGGKPGDRATLWPDPTGQRAGTAAAPAPSPGGDGDPKQLAADGLYDRIVHNLFSINVAWTLAAGFLVMFMQAGFALAETGMCRAKNAAHTMAMNLMIYALGVTAFWAYGFAIGWGNSGSALAPAGSYAALGPGLKQLDRGIGIGSSEVGGGVEKSSGKETVDETKAAAGHRWNLLGTKGFFLSGLADVSVMAYFFLMMVFFDIAATIPIGTLVERWAWKNFCLYGLWVAVPYCVYAGWVWGGGWLAQIGRNWGLGHGAVDFAGSGVVHGMGGLLALAGVLAIGPRLGKYRKDGKPQPIPGHNVTMVVLGTFILAFGWFGFNAGSTLAGTDLRISVIVVNTVLASVAGALASMLMLQFQGFKPDPTIMCNGLLSGLVAVTASCAFIDSWAAFVIGGIAGLMVVFSVFFWEKRGIDDPVGAISVHGVSGLWGLIAVGLFANGQYGVGWNGVNRPEFSNKGGVVKDGVRGLFYGDHSQLLAQLLDCAVLIVFALVVGTILFRLSNFITPLRVRKETEMEGLDGPEMGCLGYSEFVISSKS